MNCPKCDSTNVKTLLEVDGTESFRCEACGALFVVGYGLKGVLKVTNQGAGQWGEGK